MKKLSDLWGFETENPKVPTAEEIDFSSFGADKVSVENGKHSFKAVEGYPPPSISLLEIQEKIYCFLNEFVFSK